MRYNPEISLSITAPPTETLSTQRSVCEYLCKLIHNTRSKQKVHQLSKQINKLWYIHMMECYLAISMNELKTIQMDFKGIMPQNTYCI